MNSNLYALIPFPEVQKYMEKEWFEKEVKLSDNSSYFIPIERVITEDNPKYNKFISILVNKGIINDVIDINMEYIVDKTCNYFKNNYNFEILVSFDKTTKVWNYKIFSGYTLVQMGYNYGTELECKVGGIINSFNYLKL